MNYIDVLWGKYLPVCSRMGTELHFGGWGGYCPRMFGPGVDMTVIYQFLEGAKLGFNCGGHIGQSKMAALLV